MSPISTIIRKKSYDTIVSPLKKMMNDLKVYMDEQTTKIGNLTAQRNKIDTDIANSEVEIAKSKETVKKISELVSE